MDENKTQIGETVTGNLMENTWTLEMSEGFELRAGKFAILPIEEYERLTSTEKES